MTFDAGVNETTFIDTEGKLKQALIITIRKALPDLKFKDNEISLQLKGNNEKVVLVNFSRTLKNDAFEELQKYINNGQFINDYNNNIDDPNDEVNLATASAESKYMILGNMVKWNKPLQNLYKDYMNLNTSFIIIF